MIGAGRSNVDRLDVDDEMDYVDGALDQSEPKS